VPATLALLNTSLALGLSGAEAETRLDTYGPNRLSETKPRSRLSILVAQFRTVPVALLTAAAVLSLFTGGRC
jgi:Ca2+-transporting ATPase